MTTLRAAVVGAGILGRRHARVIGELEGTTLAAAVSRTRASAEALGAPAYTSLGDMLREVDCDIVHVATPDHLHGDIVLTCLAHGKHVLLEKPLATTLDDAHAMVAAAERAGLVLQVNYSQRFVAEHAWIRAQIEAGAIGRPVMVQSSKQDTIHVPTKMISWAAHTSPIFFMSSHDLDLVPWYLGGARATHISAREQRGVLEARGIAVHDGVDAIITYDANVTAHFHSSWIHPESWPTLVTERMTIIGESGVIHHEGAGRRVQLFNAEGGLVREFGGAQTATEVAGRLLGAFRDSLEHFHACVRSDTEPETSARRTLHVTETQLAILAAARQQ